jgi:predicted MFS family arabinose efflux permease
MATSTEGFVGRGALVVGHAAGMLDLVSMPLWVGVLIQFRHMSAPQAGLLITCYMVGVFLTSVSLAPRFNRLPPRLVAIGGFVLGALAFLAIIQLDGFLALVPAHFIAGIGAGSALSMVHGTISRSLRPHRLFAIANFGVAIFSIFFFATVPDLVQTNPNGLFYVLGGLLVLGALAAAIAFPQPPAESAARRSELAESVGTAPFKVAVVLAFIGVALQSTGQSQTYAFLERLGAWRGFAASDIGHMLVVSGFLNLLAPIVAAVLENRVSRIGAIAVGLLIHAVIAVTASNASGFLPYAAAGSLLVFMTIFGHTFMFGTIAHLDPSGRAASSTPAMLTLGASIGPALGGLVVQYAGFAAVGFVSAAVFIASAACFVAVGSLRAPALQPGAARV